MTNNVVEMQQGLVKLDRQQEEAEAKAKFLKPFLRGGGAYNEEAQAQRAERGLYQGVSGFFEMGCALVLIKEHEMAHTYAELLENRLRLPLRTAQFWERFARLCIRSPKFQEFFMRPGMVHKGMNLLAGLSEPEMEAELATFDETGELLGLDEVALFTKTVKEVRAENKRLRLELNRKVEAATEKFQKENLRLKKQNEELREEAGLLPGLEKELAKLEAGVSLFNEGRLGLARVDWQTLRKDAGARAQCKETFDQLRRLADWLQGLVD
jgi:hypothetical protein